MRRRRPNASAYALLEFPDPFTCHQPTRPTRPDLSDLPAPLGLPDLPGLQASQQLTGGLGLLRPRILTRDAQALGAREAPVFRGVGAVVCLGVPPLQITVVDGEVEAQLGVPLEPRVSRQTARLRGGSRAERCDVAAGRLIEAVRQQLEFGGRRVRAARRFLQVFAERVAVVEEFFLLAVVGDADAELLRPAQREVEQLAFLHAVRLDLQV